MNPHNFFAELKRRNVYKVAVAYAVVGWLLDSNRHAGLSIPGDSKLGRALVVLALVIGFPIALIIAWAFELTPQGIKRADRTGARESERPRLDLHRYRSGGTVYRFVFSGAIYRFEQTKRIE